ncbi:MAG: RnfH family protein [Gammaproteobacteria bacterium]|nr:RnfH family protein [Gammaproteobacteria bacterium]
MTQQQEMIRVEVAYARPDVQEIFALEVEAGTNAEQAIVRSGVLEKFPEIDLANNKVGIFGKLTKLQQPLIAGDRVEIYRPLLADPKEVRRRRAAEGKRMKKGGGDVASGDAVSE